MYKVRGEEETRGYLVDCTDCAKLNVSYLSNATFLIMKPFEPNHDKYCCICTE